MLDEIIEALISSIVAGSFYALLGFGLTITIGSLRIYNWAYGDYVTIAAYVVAVLTSRLSTNIVIAIVFAILSAIAVSLIVDEFIYKLLTLRGATNIQMMIATIATGLLIRYLIYIVASVNNLIIIKSRFVSTTILTYGSATLTDLDLVIIVLSVALMLFLHLLLIKTYLGKQIRAMWDNMELARIVGIRIFSIRRIVWILVGIPAGLAGALWSSYSTITPDAGWMLLLPAFAATIVGGVTSILGTILGGYLLGTSENLAMYVFNKAFSTSLAYKPLIALSVMLIALVIRSKAEFFRLIKSRLSTLSWR